MQDEVEMKSVAVAIPADANVIIGGSHFIKTVEDLFETLVESSPHIKFGIAFCEASGPRLVRTEGNDAELEKLAGQAAFKIGCGHTFVIFIKNAFPVNVLNRIKQVSEVTSVFAATANPLEVIVAQSKSGRGIMGVIDGFSPLGIEAENDKGPRKELLRKFGYKK